MKKFKVVKLLIALLPCLLLATVVPGCDEGGAGSNGWNDETAGPAAADQLDEAGPYSVLDQLRTGPDNRYRLFVPQDARQKNTRFPIIVFAAGGIMVESYKGLLHHITSHGFVIISFLPTLVPDLTTGLDWLIAENEREGSIVYQKLDTGKIAAMGQSFGALAAFQLAADPRMTTTVHLSGGTLGAHKPVQNLHAPALFICGDDPEQLDGNGVDVGDMAYVNCVADFEAATTPVFFAVVEGGSHVSVIDKLGEAGLGTDPDDPQRKLFYKAITGWLLWQLAGDPTFKEMFTGDDCDLCASDSGYIVKQKNLN